MDYNMALHSLPWCVFTLTRAPLRAYNGETVMLELPTGMTLSDYKYIAVGNKTTKVIA